MKKIVLCLVMICLLCSCGKNTNDIKVKDNGEGTTSSGIGVSVNRFYYEDGNSNVNLIIRNNNSYDVYIGEYTVNVYDKKDNLVGTFNPNFDDVLKSGKSIDQSFSVSANYSDGYRFEYIFDDVKENANE